MATKNNKNKKTNKTIAAIDTLPPRGTRDFYPEDMQFRNWLFGHWKEISHLYGFDEYDSPVLEKEELFKRKSGEDISEQLFNFIDKGNRPMALRPEMTPSLARMVMQRGNSLSMPLKWFSLPQCWRYERMTRGRRREHFQWNMDIWGVEGIEAEAELIAAIVDFLQRVGLNSNQIGIKINTRNILQALFHKINLPDEKFSQACVLVDKLDKISLENLLNDFKALGINKEDIEYIVSILQIKDIDYFEKEIGKNSSSISEIKKLFEYAEAYNMKDWLIFDPSIVRGLSYYTGMVFEVFDRSDEFRAICGGGRYDNLTETFGGKPISSVGFGFGDAVIAEVLKKHNLIPDFKSSTEVVVFAMDKELQSTAILIATRLRKMGIAVDLIQDAKKLKWALKYANRLAAEKVIILGSEEIKNGDVSIRDMENSVQTLVKLDQIETFFS